MKIVYKYNNYYGTDVVFFTKDMYMIFISLDLKLLYLIDNNIVQT